MLISLLLCPLGARALLRGARDRVAGPLLAAWFGVFALFVALGTRVDMVDKEVWFVLPAVAICAGAACDALLRWWGGRVVERALVALYLAELTWGGVTLWLVRIIAVRH